MGVCVFNSRFLELLEEFASNSANILARPLSEIKSASSFLF
ncbi:hypothetical protein GXM_09009 [Nostoc sphaeroides CCNUC1]|uniref:Uncharacterized protein n=1 Tax=Nostoc sphaeroides CCNUC1 TaxID=2653204 RepID=A0A5P8WFB3_9NOSO|nr:hypothetical protein GXM_09009 [Nostoc sphaeroides CCNUC1]